ncbi:MAG: glycosyltransferase [Bacteroidales bacterium]|jgi:glycosyltransferase involved in cell wall biosynthesis|nr:glycosyltransferase [Bacteroidales bacterium]
MSKKVSIIIPVYNVEDYLRNCLDSVVNQTFRDIEIILIDDGSTDNSLEIMKEFAEQDVRIKIISQQNSGVSTARNKGFKEANGEYFLFVDSDDTILHNSVEILYKHAIETKSDIVLGNVIYVYENGEQTIIYRRKEEIYSKSCMSGEECYVAFMKEKTFPPLVYLYFTKRELILKNNISFKEEIIHEDELWCVQVMLCATKVFLIDFLYYNYFQRNGSLMNSNNKETRIQSLFTVCKELNKIAEKLKKDNKIEVAGGIYIKIFGLYYSIYELLQQIGINIFREHNYFARLLKENYPLLPYYQQRSCLVSYLFSNSQIQQRMINSGIYVSPKE